ncbi:MAG: HAMP domain-containing histidine kinase [Bacteroidaceae bacterium]|nr:HAMP domain-containing histidine kinase [Bacteroidaceae bacterium]
MKLIYRLIIRLSAVLLPILALWAAIFYYAMVEEINDETDDSLEDYAVMIIRRVLTGNELPSSGDRTNNTYSVELLPEGTDTPLQISFRDEKVYIPEKRETEPARVVTIIFADAQHRKYKIEVSTPTFERIDLLQSVLLHIIALYIILTLTIITVTAVIFHYSMRPLYALLKWLDNYHPGKGVDDLPANSNIPEFKKLTKAAHDTIERAEQYMERQKQFIGNASHELQTPLAILSTRIEWIIDNTQLTEEQFAELSKMRQSLHRLVKLNRTLLLLSKIDNGQFPEKKAVDLVEIIENEVEIYKDIYADCGISCTTTLPTRYIVEMNESLATTMVTNLIKNAFVHSELGSNVGITIEKGLLTISNDGEEQLDGTRLFDRFYTSGKKESTGLGLALVKSIATRYGFEIKYAFCNKRHQFSVKMSK